MIDYIISGVFLLILVFFCGGSIWLAYDKSKREWRKRKAEESSELTVLSSGREPEIHPCDWGLVKKVDDVFQGKRGSGE